MNQAAIQFVQQNYTLETKKHPTFKAGDNVTVNYKIKEGGKERTQGFRGDVIKIQGTGITKTFTVRKISDGVGVERLFPLSSPNIDTIELNKVGRVRRAKLFLFKRKKWKKCSNSRKKNEIKY